MGIIIDKCEHCDGENDRREYSNWCSKCANAQETERKAMAAQRQREFDEHMRNRPA